MELLTPKFQFCVGYKTIQPAQKNNAQQGNILDKSSVISATLKIPNEYTLIQQYNRDWDFLNHRHTENVCV